MTKFWMVVAAILFGLTTGCPDGDDDADALCIPACAPGYVCLYGDCAPEGSDTDADADSDTTEDDADTSETVDCPTCPDVSGDWDLTYRNTETGGTWTGVLTLEQTTGSNIVIGFDEYFEYSGTISESGYISLFGDGSVTYRTVSGNFTQTPPIWRALGLMTSAHLALGGPIPNSAKTPQTAKCRMRGYFYLKIFYYFGTTITLPAKYVQGSFPITVPLHSSA